MVHCQLADHHGDMKLKRPENRIREVRQALGISQEVLGERLGTDGSQIHKLENGKLRLTLDWMVKIAEALGCDLADLLPVMPNTKAHARADLLRRIDLLRHLVEAEQFATAFQSGEVMMRNLSAAASKFPDVKE
ncbi:DNA-binding XRE family transcriptional regulator [Nitrospirillum bahiense]|uniref:DNA-binding XRE family transcriptional regulator n=2 Tax=Nitrospirillum amazonense TaxID=28077 RepID=A0A560F1Y3_9PROT|nr:DNA-binding XRE family transcriptional regulator [Nitrospirillum amazonense]